MPRNYLLDLLFDVLDGHLILLLTKRYELLIRHFADFILAKDCFHGVKNLFDGGIGSTANLLHCLYDHVFKIDVFSIGYRGLLIVDKAVSIRKGLEVLTQRLTNLGGKSLRKLDALSLLDIVEDILLGAGLVRKLIQGLCDEPQQIPLIQVFLIHGTPDAFVEITKVHGSLWFG